MSSFVPKRLLSVSISISISIHLNRSRLLSTVAVSPSESLRALFKSHKFSDAHISALFSKRPSLLRYRPRSLAPKIAFLLSDAAAVPPSLLPDLVIADPSILTRSIDHHLRPIFELLRCFIESADDLALLVRRQRWLFCRNFSASLGPNVAALLALDVSHDHIAKLMTIQPQSLTLKSEFFRANIETVVRAGIKPESPMFVHALRALNGMRRSTWEARLKMFENMGWEKDLVFDAFRRAPLFVLVSEEKAKKSMEFFTKEMGFGPEELTLQPKLLMYSLEKRIIPRFRVFQMLEGKGLLRNQPSEKHKKMKVSLFTCTDKVFLEKYVMKYSEKAPELANVFLEKVEMDAMDSEKDQGGRVAEA